MARPRGATSSGASARPAPPPAGRRLDDAVRGVASVYRRRAGVQALNRGRRPRPFDTRRGRRVGARGFVLGRVHVAAVGHGDDGHGGRHCHFAPLQRAAFVVRAPAAGLGRARRAVPGVPRQAKSQRGGGLRLGALDGCLLSLIACSRASHYNLEWAKGNSTLGPLCQGPRASAAAALAAWALVSGQKPRACGFWRRPASRWPSWFWPSRLTLARTRIKPEHPTQVAIATACSASWCLIA